MEMDTVKAGVVFVDGCPPALRAVVVRWKANAATNHALEEAACYAGLDGVEEYKKKPFPTPPARVKSYQALRPSEREAWSVDERKKLFLDHASFFEQVSMVRGLNSSNRHFLQQLDAWAVSKLLPPAIRSRIGSALDTHRQVLEDAPGDETEPF